MSFRYVWCFQTSVERVKDNTFIYLNLKCIELKLYLKLQNCGLDLINTQKKLVNNC